MANEIQKNKNLNWKKYLKEIKTMTILPKYGMKVLFSLLTKNNKLKFIINIIIINDNNKINK